MSKTARHFSGTSTRGDFSEAVGLAVEEAKATLTTDFVAWTFVSISGRYGGFALQTDLTVTIEITATAPGRRASKSAVSLLRWRSRAAAPPAAALTRAFSLASEEVAGELGVMRAALAAGMPVPFLDKSLSAKEQALILLRAAAEVELALMVQYLCAYFTVNTTSAFGSTVLDEVNDKRPKDFLLGVAIEEMGHLLTVQNLLIGLGEEPHFMLQSEEEDAPQAGIYPFPLQLEPVGESALAKYLIAESPITLPTGFPDAELVATANEIAQQALGGKPVVHVGGLYAKLQRIFTPEEEAAPGAAIDAEMEVKHLTEAEYVGHEGDQQDPDGKFEDNHGTAFFTRAAFSLAAARGALKEIGDQGEGWDAPVEPVEQETHFERFLTLFKLFRQHPANAALTVATNCAAVIEGDPPVPAGRTEITSTNARAHGQLFRVRFEVLLLLLSHLFTLPHGQRRDDLRRRTIIEMRCISDIGGKLTDLPVTDGSSLNAGPPFFMPVAIPEDPAQQVAWLQLLFDKTDALLQLTGNYNRIKQQNPFLRTFFQTT